MSGFSDKDSRMSFWKNPGGIQTSDNDASIKSQDLPSSPSGRSGNVAKERFSLRPDDNSPGAKTSSTTASTPVKLAGPPLSPTGSGFAAKGPGPPLMTASAKFAAEVTSGKSPLDRAPSDRVSRLRQAQQEMDAMQSGEWHGNLQLNLAKSIQAGLVTADYSALLLCDFRVVGVPGKPPTVFKALVDCGSQTSCLNVTVVKKMGLEQIVDSSFARAIGGIGGASAGGNFGRIHYATIAMGESSHVEFPIALEVLNLAQVTPAGAANKFDAILGLDFLARNKAEIDLQELKMKIGGAKGSTKRVDVKLSMVKDK